MLSPSTPSSENCSPVPLGKMKGDAAKKAITIVKPNIMAQTWSPVIMSALFCVVEFFVLMR